ncbi:hypothetical protein SKAU_G00136080 [Synaphobranchus kaupii]|uniref:Uncharacterized protein n=1 Tax=Synaphobranchus kaupii TaxID=118154 RepID=A0A9Q1FRG5_SYNKA|nr:hypothetical protein SKAU_G00136080 [Synaphobranchus kaupii]
MMKRLLETKIPLSEVLEEQGIDTLLTSDWSKLENLVKVMEPIAIHTDQLQTDSQSLSDVVPCLLNLEAHLQATTIGKQSAQVLLQSLKDCNHHKYRFLASKIEAEKVTTRTWL